MKNKTNRFANGPCCPWARTKMVQQRLKAFGFYHGSPDGCYSKRTKRAVIDFQTWSGLPSTGFVTIPTWNALFGPHAKSTSQYIPFSRILRLRIPNMRGRDIMLVQQKLKQLAFLQSYIDGIFGIETYQAVKAFQSFAHLNIDGTVGLETWNALF